MTHLDLPPVSGEPVLEDRPGRWTGWLDRLAGSDPGYNRLITATRAVTGLAAVIGAEWLFIHLTGALQVAADGRLPAPEVAAQHHSVLVIAMLLAGVPAVVSGFAINDRTARSQLVSMLIVPVPIVVALTVGLVLGPHRYAALASFPVLMAIAGYLRRFGPRGFTTGVLFFIGDFIGYFLHTQFGLGDLGWLTAEIGVGVAALLVVRFTLFFPNAYRVRRRTQRSYHARARRVAELALAVLEGPTASTRRRLTRQLVRLNEAALIIDANLPAEAVVPHQRLFDIELALTNMARLTVAMATGDRFTPRRPIVARALAAVRDDNLPVAYEAAQALTSQVAEVELAPGEDMAAVIIPHRFATSVRGLVEALDDWTRYEQEGSPRATDDLYEPFSLNAAGWLPGTADVSALAATQSGPKRIDRVRLPLYARAGIQMGVSVAVAVVAGSALSSKRFYWAVLAAFLAFIGTNFAMEQIRKAVYRVIGTVVGIVVGGVLAHVVGHHSNWSVAIILVSLYIGVYLFRVSYAFMVIAITVAIAQVYVELGEFSNSLLLLRLEETLIGAGAAIATIVLVLPLGTRRVMGVALAEELRALTRLVTHTVDRLAHPDLAVGRHRDARDLDAAFQALYATSQPLRRNPLGDVSEDITTTVVGAFAVRNYGRNLVTDSERTPGLDPPLVEAVRHGGQALQSSVDVLVAACDGDHSGTYVRAASLFDQVDHTLGYLSPTDPRRLVIRDLQLIDGALARIASVWKVGVTSRDVGYQPAVDGHRSTGVAAPPDAGPAGNGATPPQPADAAPGGSVSAEGAWEASVSLTFRLRSRRAERRR